MAGLTIPAEADELYLARGAEVEPYRPILTGDVFREVVIPGVSDSPGLAMVLAHPCSMREGAHLRSHVSMASVQPRSPIVFPQWDGNYGAMPLPDLVDVGDQTLRATFELSGRVDTAGLARHLRVASLSPLGLLVLLQRLAHYLTRVVIDLDTLLESVEHVLEEADLFEEWTRARWGLGAGPADAVLACEAEFDEIMRRDVGSTTARHALRDPKLRATVRRLVATELGQRGAQAW
jgi:hypothetical protein